EASRLAGVRKGSAHGACRRTAEFRGVAAPLLSFFVAKYDRRAPFPGGLSRVHRSGGRVAPSGSALHREAATVQWLFGMRGSPRVHPFSRNTESPTADRRCQAEDRVRWLVSTRTQPTRSLPALGFVCLAPRRSNNAPRRSPDEGSQSVRIFRSSRVARFFRPPATCRETNKERGQRDSGRRLRGEGARLARWIPGHRWRY